MKFQWSLLLAFALLGHGWVAAETSPSQHGSVILPDGTNLAYHVRPGTGPTLVLIPGSWGDYRVFDGFMEHLDDNVRVIVVELRGHGDSQPATLTPSMELFGDDVLEVIRALGLTRYYLGGHSIGGMLAIEIAGRHPTGLVGVIPMEGWTHHTVSRNAFGSDVASTLTPEEEATRQAWRARVQDNLSQAEIDAFAQVWKQWNGYAALENTPLPILEIWGDRAQPTPTREALQVPDRPNIEIAWIEGASHSYLIEDPAAVANAVNVFLQAHEGR